MYVAVNSHTCCIWIVNDITDSDTCLFSVSYFFLSFYFCILPVRKYVSICACQCECVCSC